VGEATEAQHLRVEDPHFNNNPIDLPLDVLLGKTPKMHRDVKRSSVVTKTFDTSCIDVADAAERLLRLPTIAEKTFLITIGDRSVTGLVHRDQMVGPWQIPVADVAVTAAAFDTYAGEAMALGERTPSALLNHGTSARLAVAEALTNIAAAPIGDLKRIKLSANWMTAAGHPGEDAGLYEAVKAIGEELCPALDLAIPVGKDSMSMKMRWQDENQQEQVVTSPLSLIITAFGAVTDIRKTLTPQLMTDKGDTQLIYIDISAGKGRLGASCLTQVYNELGDESPDVDDAQVLKVFFNTVQKLNSQQLLLAYHDVSDGGVFTTVSEMAFAGKVGVSINLDSLHSDTVRALFSEELGAVVQVRADDAEQVLAVLSEAGLEQHSHVIGCLNQTDKIEFSHHGNTVLSSPRLTYRQAWAETTHNMQTLRDNPDCAKQEFVAKSDSNDPGLHASLSYDVNQDIAAPYIATGVKPAIAILREQGVNSHVEMAAAFDRAGFSSIDVHMSDLLAGRVSLDQFKGLVACGGFSYGDVLGAGEGWAKTILFNNQLRDQFEQFFHRADSFSLGVCNGCQMLSNLKPLIPGADLWSRFVTNKSERFEARVAMVEVMDSPSVLMQGMAGSRMPIAVSHGEGRAEFANQQAVDANLQQQRVALRYVDNYGNPTEQYPANPNGSPAGITALTSKDGRATIMMPHPERVFRTVANSWAPEEWQEDSAWMRMFRNARAYVG
jgi:phosphoribosylformylglycinamidine synthase